MATRNMVMRKSYIVPGQDKPSRSAKADWTALRFDVLAPEKNDKDEAVILETVEVSRDRFSPEIFACAAGHGFMQKIGDNLAGLDKKAEKAEVSWDTERGYADFVVELINDMADNLANGVWVEEGEGTGGGGNVTILLEAVQRAYAAAGRPVSESGRRALLQRFADGYTAADGRQVSGKEAREEARKIPSVALQIAKIVAERQAARLAKLQEAAQAPNSNDGLANLGILGDDDGGEDAYLGVAQDGDDDDAAPKGKRGRA